MSTPAGGILRHRVRSKKPSPGPGTIDRPSRNGVRINRVGNPGMGFLPVFPPADPPLVRSRRAGSIARRVNEEVFEEMRAGGPMQQQIVTAAEEAILIERM